MNTYKHKHKPRVVSPIYTNTYAPPTHPNRKSKAIRTSPIPPHPLPPTKHPLESTPAAALRGAADAVPQERSAPVNKR